MKVQEYAMLDGITPAQCGLLMAGVQGRKSQHRPVREMFVHWDAADGWSAQILFELLPEKADRRPQFRDDIIQDLARYLFGSRDPEAKQWARDLVSWLPVSDLVDLEVVPV